MPTTALCSLSCLSAHVHERISMDSYRIISREAITACCPQCGMHLKSMGLELYSQHSFQQGEPSKTLTVCPLKTCPSVPQNSALAYTFCPPPPFLRPLYRKGNYLCTRWSSYSGRNADNTFKCWDRFPLHLYLSSRGSGVLWIYHYVLGIIESSWSC